MLTHRNPQASVSKQAPSDNFNTIDTTCEPFLISPHLRLVEIAPGDADARTKLLHWPGASANEPPLLNSSCRSTRPRWVLRIARMERAR
jgi:hypothetical protein